jgi:hypothetical protein
MLIAGDDDSPALNPEVPRRVTYDEANRPKFYLVLKGAAHVTFGNRSCGQALLYRAVKRNPHVNEICRYGLAFFEKYLRGDLSAGRQLEESDPAWAYYIKEEKPGESFQWGGEPAPGEGGPGGIREEFMKKREWWKVARRRSDR